MYGLLSVLALLSAPPCERPIEVAKVGDLSLSVYVLEAVSCQPPQRLKVCLEEKAVETGSIEEKCEKSAVGAEGVPACRQRVYGERSRACMPTCLANVVETLKGPSLDVIRLWVCPRGADPDTSRYLLVTDQNYQNGGVVEFPWCVTTRLATYKSIESLLHCDTGTPDGCEFEEAYWRTLIELQAHPCLDRVLAYVASGSVAERAAAMRFMDYASSEDDWEGDYLSAVSQAPIEAFQDLGFVTRHRQMVRLLLAREKGGAYSPVLERAVQQLVEASRVIGRDDPASQFHFAVCAGLRAVNAKATSTLPEVTDALDACPVPRGVTRP